MDPFLDLIRLLRPQATLWRDIEATGRWAVCFRKRNDLLFCSVARGECLLLRPSTRPQTLATGDFVLIRTSTPFTLASHRTIPPVDSEKAFALPTTSTLTLGTGQARPTTLHGGRFLFNTASESLLTGLLPPLIHVSATATSAERVHTFLRLNAAEAATPRPGSAFVIARLMELLFVDLLRDPILHAESRQLGMLGGLADPVVSLALRAMHQRISHRWTVVELARHAGVSRSTFAERFQQAVGTGPIQYLHTWRMAIARDELRQPIHRSLSEIAFALGFQSISAFSTAFRRSVGVPPGQYALRPPGLADRSRAS